MVDAIGVLLAARMLAYLDREARRLGATEEQLVATLVALGITGPAYYRALAEFRRLATVSA